MLKDLKSELNQFANLKKAELFRRFFKTGLGEYGEGDQFLGLTVPQQRKIAHKYVDLELADLGKLLKSSFHEHRFTALVILVNRYKRAKKQGNQAEQKKIYQFYFANLDGVNNWDLVDSSAPYIVGDYLLDRPKDRKVLYDLASDHNLWKRRVAMLATAAFIKHREFDDTLKIAGILVNDRHDLIHKAVGWMLREIGKLDLPIEEGFLDEHYQTMPRTMLRYSIEKFSETKRRHYLQKNMA